MLNFKIRHRLESSSTPQSKVLMREKENKFKSCLGILKSLLFINKFVVRLALRLDKLTDLIKII